jgi:hypothetical protein
MSGPLPITPDTKVAQLLEAYPELEPVLIAAAPAFSKLSNPVLRRTIARVTSLKRAAEVAGMPVRDLVLRLRQAAGQPADVDASPEDAGSAADGPASWVDAAQVRWTIDADHLLESGQEPMPEVLRRAAELGTGDLGLIRSSFRPAPLIELLEGRGFRTAVVRAEESFATFIGLRPGAD